MNACADSKKVDNSATYKKRFLKKKLAGLQKKVEKGIDKAIYVCYTYSIKLRHVSQKCRADRENARKGKYIIYTQKCDTCRMCKFILSSKEENTIFSCIGGVMPWHTNQSDRRRK